MPNNENYNPPERAKKGKKKHKQEKTRNLSYLAGQEPDAAAIGLLLDPDNENRTDLEGKELDTVHVAAEGVIIHALDPLRVQHRVLARRQAHVLHCEGFFSPCYFPRRKM